MSSELSYTHELDGTLRGYAINHELQLHTLERDNQQIRGSQRSNRTFIAILAVVGALVNAMIATIVFLKH
jgi:hypothetical protein